MSQKKTTPTTTDSSEKRDLEAITEEILGCKGEIEQNYLRVGRLLIEAKAQVEHGYWFAWLKDNVDISAVTARRYMRLAEAFAKGSPVTAFGYSKASVLMTLPDKERDTFIKATHEVNGAQKETAKMSKRELEDAVRAHMKCKLPKPSDPTVNGQSTLEESGPDPEKIFVDKLAKIQVHLADMLSCLDALGDYPDIHAGLAKDLLAVCEDAIQRLDLNAPDAA